MLRLRTLLLAGCALTALSATAVMAEPAAAPATGSASLIASTRTAVVNIQGIMRDATAAKSVREALEAKQKSYQAEISKKEQALQKEEQELAKQRGVLSQDAFDAKVKAFRTKETEAQKEVQDKKATLDAGFERALGQIQKAVGDIIAEMSKEKGFVIALPTSQMLYADSSMDISQEVLTKLNARLPKVDVKFDAPAAAPAADKK